MQFEEFRWSPYCDYRVGEAWCFGPLNQREVIIMPIIIVAYAAILALAVWQDEHGTHGEC
mgnify:CR=1 FL=1|jgi:hypothetical protein